MPLTSKQRLIPLFLATRRRIPQAMIDHAEMVIGDWPVSGPAHDVLRFLDAIPEIEGITAAGECVRTFTATNRSPDGRRVEIAVTMGKPGNVAYQTVPIFGGKLVHAFGTGRVPRSTPGEFLRLGLNASLNLNKFFMAQTVHPKSRVDRPRLRRPLATAFAGAFASDGDEYCLTKDTNVVIGPDALYGYILSKRAEDHFLDYVRLVEELLTNELQSTASSYGATVSHARYYSLRKLEFMWEFEHPQPLWLVESLDIPIRAVGRESRRRPARAQILRDDFWVYADSICITSELSGGCEIAVYAKTNKRVRFEVRFNDDAIAAVLQKARGNASRTARTRSDLCRMLRLLREAATRRLKDALARLDRLLVPPPSDISVLQLAATIGRILQDDSLTDTILGVLRLRGSLASARGSPNEAAAFQLMEAGILRRNELRSPVFEPTDRYVRAVRDLRRLA